MEEKENHILKAIEFGFDLGRAYEIIGDCIIMMDENLHKDEIWDAKKKGLILENAIGRLRYAREKMQHFILLV